jgi:hypothetical protein
VSIVAFQPRTQVAGARAGGRVATSRRWADDATGTELPVLAEAVSELARRLREAQDRAARAEADARELRRKLADTPGRPEHHAALWLAANEQYLRTLPGAAAREAAGRRLAGDGRVRPSR